MPGLAVQNYATYPSMPGALRALCPDFRGVITGIRPYARYQVRLRGVAASQPLEGDCTAGACQCGAGIVGPDVVLDLPGGSGQLVALSMLNTTLLDPRGNTAL